MAAYSMECPTVSAGLPTLSAETRRDIEGIPGVRLRGQQVRAAWHAVPALGATLQAAGLSAYGVIWAIPPLAPPSWEWVHGELAKGGEVKPWVLDFLTPYQRDGLVFAWHKSGSLLNHPTGAGKSLSAIMWCLAAPGAAVIVTRATSRRQFAGQVEQFTNLSAYPLVPRVSVRKRDRWQSPEDYLSWCETRGQRPILIVGWESLSDWLPLIESIGVTSVVWDESHKGKSNKRWEVIPLPEGEERKAALAGIKARGGFVKPGTEDGTEVGIVPRENTAHAAMTLARIARRRLATTATPISDRVRDLWGQLDLIEPGAWGSFSTFAHRYCAAKPGMYGGLDTSGLSNANELGTRLAYVVHHVDYTITHAQLPRKRRESYYIAKEDQVEPSGGFAKWAKDAATAGPGAILELRLAEAASKKRRAVLARIADHAASGHKIVVFTARRRDCDELASAIRGAIRGVTTWAAHGGNSHAEREQVKAEYISHPGPCVLVGTGDAWGTSIDGLQCTDAAFFVLLPYTPGQLTQWEGRFSRLGQDRPVVIYYCIAEGTVDEHVADLLITKLGAVDNLVADGSSDGMSGALSGIAGNEEAILDAILAKLGVD